MIITKITCNHCNKVLQSNDHSWGDFRDLRFEPMGMVKVFHLCFTCTKLLCEWMNIP